MTGHNDAAGAAIRLRNWVSLDPTQPYSADPYMIEIFRADLRAVLAELAEARRQNDALTTRIADLEAQLDTASARHCGLTAEVEGATARMVELEDERDRARQMLRYCHKRWPAPIFWQAAAQIDDPYTALPDWLTADTSSKEQT